MENAIIAAAHPVGNAIARQDAPNTTKTTAFGFMPPASAVETAIGVMIAMVPLLLKNVVIITVTTQNTVITRVLDGLLPKSFSTKSPIS